MFPLLEEFFFSILFNHFSMFHVVYRFVFSGSSPFSTAHFTAITFKLLLCCLIYSFTTSLFHPDRRLCTASLCSPHNLHLSHSIYPLIFYHALASIICSCNANVDNVYLGSVFCFNQPEPSSLYCCVVSF